MKLDKRIVKTGLALTVCIAVLPVTALAKSDFADWRESLRWQVCVNQPVFHQEKEDMKKELEVTLANLLAVENVSSVRALGRKTALKLVTRLRINKLLMMAVVAEDEPLRIDLAAAIQSICSRPVTPALQSSNACSYMTEMAAAPKAMQDEMKAQLAYLREARKATGHVVHRPIDGGSSNVIDERGVKTYHVGYGFWSLVKTGKLCLWPAGCEYTEGPPRPERAMAAQPEYEAISIPNCIKREKPGTEEKSERANQLIESFN